MLQNVTEMFVSQSSIFCNTHTHTCVCVYVCARARVCVCVHDTRAYDEDDDI